MATPNLCHLLNVQTRMERLRGLDSDVLRAAGFDEMLDELQAVASNLSTLRDVVSEVAGIDEAIALLLGLLQSAEDKPLHAASLKHLLEPLHGSLHQQTERLGVLI
ncbi:hypothetical protein [Paludibacterium paludis]|uniref:DUF1484 family protein n=1 Tax=Paludibacterium paludis TaxID=1225769 RepID=A0A918NX34_9NEIS|nr:hypothetical protein [Paludibacterium paludis]GGY03944.1 hypothetical protein GCM10011289_02890 [Paludibacterium paludis]